MKKKRVMLPALILTAGISMAVASAGVSAKTVQETQSEKEIRTPGPERTGNPSDSFREWNPSFRLSIDRESDLMESSGMTLREWDGQVGKMKAEGFASPITEEEIRKADPAADIRKKDGRIYYIGKTTGIPPVRNALEAYRAACAMTSLLGVDENHDLRLWSRLQVKDQTIYVFQQVEESREVLGSVLKIAAAENGEISAVFSSLNTEPAKRENVLTQDEAEKAVHDRLEKEGENAEILTEFTERIIHSPYYMEMLSLEDENIYETDYWWVIYTENRAEDTKKEYPYTAHYLTLDGQYQYSLPVKEPGDEEARKGARRQQVFEHMKAGTWTGDVTGINGETSTITVPVMQSEDNGKWYLGDLERRIAIADFATAAYQEEHPLVLECRENNEGWDNEDLFFYYNYIRTYDFYADMGWMGPDGEGTDVIILKDLCTEDGIFLDNACSIGKVENWEMFGYNGVMQDGTPLGLGQALDVIAHEFTHAVTATVMDNNLYENDLGAINESMSDIMGNLVEQICDATDDTGWNLGENTGSVIRCMSVPSLYEQPEFVWDMNYGPHTDNPTTANDRGGVHFNSSLLNKIAAKLCIEKGMSEEEAAFFWMAAAFGLTPGADYSEMEPLLSWAMEVSGTTKYQEGLSELIRETDINRRTLPETLPEGRKLVRLDISGNDALQDPGWVLFGYQFDTDLLKLYLKRGREILREMSENPEDLMALVKTGEELADLLGMQRTRRLLEKLDTADEDQVVESFTREFVEAAGRLFTYCISWEEDGTRQIPMVLKDRNALYLLLNVRNSGTEPGGAAILLGDRWYDISGILEVSLKTMDGEFSGEVPEEVLEEIFKAAADKVLEIAEDKISVQLDKIRKFDLKDFALKKLEQAEDAVVGRIRKAGDLLLGEKSAEGHEAGEAVENPETAETKEPAAEKSAASEAEYLPTAGLENVKLLPEKE